MVVREYVLSTAANGEAGALLLSLRPKAVQVAQETLLDRDGRFQINAGNGGG